MSVTIAMPQLGLTMTEGTVSSWHKQIGETVQKDEILLVISTDKVDMDVEAPEDGKLERILVESGETVPVGTALAYLTRPGEEVDVIAALEEDEPDEISIPTPAAEPVAQSSKAPSPTPSDSNGSSGRIIASPRAKRLASELNIDLSSVSGSGPQGRIGAEDVQRASAKQMAGQPANAAAPPKPAVAPRYASPANEDVRRRQMIADRMVESITTIPSFSVSLEVNAESLVTLHSSLKGPLQRDAGVKLTYTDLLLKALAIAEALTPEIRTLWNDGSPRHDPALGLGLAVATDRGVVAPVLKAVDRLSLDEISRARAQLTEKARQSRLTFEDLSEASGTLSNLGMYRVDRFQGIITPGQTYILAVGAIRNRPWVEGVIAVKPTLILTLSVDHRVADGAVAAVFLERLAEVIENPYQLLWGGKRGQ